MDGKGIKVYANIGSAGDMGLFHSELIHLDPQDFPTKNQQFMLYKRVVGTMVGKKVIIRYEDWI